MGILTLAVWSGNQTQAPAVKGDASNYMEITPYIGNKDQNPKHLYPGVKK